MKSTGIVRKVDELGRIVLPVELRSANRKQVPTEALKLLYPKTGRYSVNLLEWYS